MSKTLGAAMSTAIGIGLGWGEIDDPYRYLALGVIAVALEDCFIPELQGEALLWVIGWSEEKRLYAELADVTEDAMRLAWLRQMRADIEAAQRRTDAMFAEWDAEDAARSWLLPLYQGCP